MIKRNSGRIIYLVVLIIAIFILISFEKSLAQVTLSNRSVKLSNSYISEANVNYLFTFAMPGGLNVQSIEFEFCDTDPFPGTLCPDQSSNNGFDSRHDEDLNIINQQGEVGFSIHPASSTESRIVLTRAPSPLTTAQTVEYEFENIVNSSVTGTHFIRISVYSSDDATTGRLGEGGLAYSINDDLSISTEVPPFLLFCVANIIHDYECQNTSGNTIDFGIFKPSETSTATTQMITATNAEYGYNLRVYGTTLTAGNSTIPRMMSPIYSLKGNSQFGLNLRANTNPPIGKNLQGGGSTIVASDYGAQNKYKFENSNLIAYSNTTSSHNKITVSYIVNVSSQQNQGRYTSTLTFICLANF